MNNGLSKVNKYGSQLPVRILDMLPRTGGRPGQICNSAPVFLLPNCGLILGMLRSSQGCEIGMARGRQERFCQERTLV